MAETCLQFTTVLNKHAVTSIKFLNNCIIAGIGGSLFVFELEIVKLKTRIEIFENAVIHGISHNSNKSKMCVFGGRFVSVLSAVLSSADFWIKIDHKWRFGDWVLCCQWVSAEDCIAILSAQNVLTLWNCTTGENLTQVSCTQKCILYSATILSDHGWSDTVVIAGTVFQQICIWAVGASSAKSCPVIHSLKGHNGVIFSVTYDKRTRLISSTSDDRSIRVWSVISPADELMSAEDWKNASITLVLTMFGHTARVWHSYILEDKKIISVGEDSQLCLWSAGGECISRQDAHQGAGIWCMDVSESMSLIVTGGADGGVSLWPLNIRPHTCRSLPPPGDTPRRIVLLQSYNVLVVTESGSLMCYSLTDHSWTLVFSDVRISSYCILEVSPTKQLVAMATIHGHIIIIRSIDFSTVIDETIEGGRIFSLHWLDGETLVSCQDKGNLSIWRISNFVLKEVGEVYLPPCKEHWTTAAVLFKSTIIYGDRGGNIHSSPITLSHQHPKEVVQTVQKAHSKQGVCSLKVLGSHVWSSGRNGTIKQFAVVNHSIALISCVVLPVDWLVYISHSHSFGPVVLAFHEYNVELWSIEEVRRLTCLPCGGGHRSWSCSVEEDQFCFTFLKDKTAHILQCPLLQIAKPIVKEGFHTKEINSMSVLSDAWVVSGSEDGSVRLSTITGDCWTTPVIQNTHVSSVRAVHVCSLKHRTLLFSAGGRAQMKIWNVNLGTQTSMTELNSVMLREEKRGRHWLNSVPSLNPDTRYMDLHTIPKSDNIVWVLIACSDSFLRIFHYNVEKNHIELKSSVTSGPHCLLRVTSILSATGRRVVVTSGTSGHVTFWDAELDPPVVVAHEHLHQCGVNGLSVLERQGALLVASGGDDSQLSLTYYLVETTSSLSIRKLTSWTCNSLHSSVITGVQIVGDWVVCSGGDQRIFLVSWSLDGSTLSADIISQKCCSVPDIKGLSVLQFDGSKLVICVFGVGLEVLELMGKKS